MEKALVCAYRLPGGARLEEAIQRDGCSLWAVRNSGNCMAHDGQWEWEPQPSSRDADFMARCRFATVEEAYLTWERAQAALPNDLGIPGL